MNRIAQSLLLLGSVSFIQFGCGKEEAKPEPLPEPKPQVQPPASKPTTQSVVDEKRKTLQLQVIPFRLEAPESWKIVSHEASSAPKSIVLLESKVIDADFVADMSGPINLSANQVKLVKERAAKDAEAYKKNGGSVTVRETGTMIFIDRRKMPAVTTTAPTSQPDLLPPTVEWQMFMLVPSGIGYEQYEIHCFEFSPDAYAKNEKFLTDIFSTITYDNSPVGGLPPRP